MTLLTLKARVCCDACGKNYDVEIDPAAKCDSAFNAVEDAMIGGEGSFYDGVMRCDDCTGTYVAQWIADNPTKISGIEPVSGGWYVTTFADVKHFIGVDNPIGEPQFEREISGYLIAAAGPAMLAALKRIDDLIEATVDLRDGRANQDASIRLRNEIATQIDAAIAQAEGR